MCAEYPCGKYKDADLSDSFITHKNQFPDSAKAKQTGIKAYMKELNEKIRVLERLLDNYDDGRQKGFFCLTVNLLDLPDVKLAMKQIAREAKADTPLKVKAAIAVRLLEKIAAERGVSLKLRGKEKS